MSDQEYEDIEKIFGGSWRVDRDENLEDFMTAAGNRVFFPCVLLQILLSCQPRLTETSCFVYKVIRDLKSIDHLCINPILRIGLIHK